MNKIICGEALEELQAMPDDSVDVVVTSPPYANQRTYEGSVAFRNDDHWLDWAATRFMECLRVSRGPVFWIVEGYTKKGTFHPLPEMLTVEIMRRVANIRRRNIFYRFGIPGGSPDDFAQHHEIVVCATSNGGRMPFADPKATGSPPKCKPGGRPSHQSKDGRVNKLRKHQAKGGSEKMTLREYKPPTICKASDVIVCGSVGGGNMGSKLSSENEAPFPEKIVRPYVLSYCPPGGTVLDCFSGSGTTAAVAIKLGRKFIAIEQRETQVDVIRRRVTEAEDIFNRSLPCCGDRTCELCGGVGYVTLIGAT